MSQGLLASNVATAVATLWKYVLMHFFHFRENLERVIYFLLMDRKNKVSYEDEELPAYHMPRPEGKKARLRNLRKFNFLDKNLIFFFLRCALLYLAYKVMIFALNKFINTVNDVAYDQ